MHGFHPVSQDALSCRYTQAERIAHQRMTEQVSARCTFCTPAPSTPPRQHTRLSCRRQSKPRTAQCVVNRQRSNSAHPAIAATARTQMPTTRALQASDLSHRHLRPGRPPVVAVTGGIPAIQASTLPRPHPASAATAHTPMHDTRDCPTRARACARPAPHRPESKSMARQCHDRGHCRSR
jgi:hypothetical protein